MPAIAWIATMGELELFFTHMNGELVNIEQFTGLGACACADECCARIREEASKDSAAKARVMLI